MAVQDLERTLRALRDVLQANLDAKLTEITTEYTAEDATEYGGSVTLEPIPTANYFANSAPCDLNVGLFIVYSIQTVVVNSIGSHTAKDYSIATILGHTGLKNNSSHNLIESKLMRYTRAIEEVIRENFDKVVSGYSIVSVGSYPAIPELQLETGETLRVSGLEFTANIA